MTAEQQALATLQAATLEVNVQARAIAAGVDRSTTVGRKYAEAVAAEDVAREAWLATTQGVSA